MAGGRPPEWDTDFLKREIILWARLPNSLNINAFCCSLDPEIDPDYLLYLIKKDPEFSRIHRIVKTYLSARREEANSEKLLSDAAFKSALRHYDLFLKEDWKEEETFKANLSKEIETDVSKQKESDFKDFINQMQSLSSKAKIEDSKISNDK